MLFGVFQGVVGAPVEGRFQFRRRLQGEVILVVSNTPEATTEAPAGTCRDLNLGQEGTKGSG